MKYRVLVALAALATAILCGCSSSHVQQRSEAPTTSPSQQVIVTPYTKGGDSPTSTTSLAGATSLVTDAQVTQLEQSLDAVQANLDQVDQFSLGTQ